MATSREDIIRQLDALEPAIRDRFLEAIATLVAAAEVGRLERLIRDGRVPDVLAELGLSAAAFSRLVEAIRAAFVAGGEYEARNMPRIPRRTGGSFRLLFNVQNPRAEAWLREQSSRLVTAIIDDQREAIRQVVAEGTRLGRNPRQTALDIVGRIDRQTGRRTGGIVGLTSQQARYVTNARAQLLSGDPDQLREYLTRRLRDRRFDGIVRRAIAAEAPVSLKDVERITGRYADRLLRFRGETIARTEALAAFNVARDEAYLQAIDTGSVAPQNVTKTWGSVGDARTRDAHAAMHGQKRAMGEPFRSPTGALLKHPGDASLGAGAADLANCRCAALYRVDFLAQGLANAA